jgi:ribonuclease HII
VDTRDRTIAELLALVADPLEEEQRDRLIDCLAQDPRAGARRLGRKLEAQRGRQARWQALCDPERHLRNRGHARIAGVDEAGRGPLAGPVVAAAVILPDAFTWFPLDDSKRMSPARRRQGYQIITREALGWSVGVAGHEEIDRHNIVGALHLAVDRALRALVPTPDFALVDGRPLTTCPIPHQAIVQGDRRCRAIAAASVIAKVTRDRIMDRMAECYPGYGFEQHHGYGTRRHLEALERLGPCPIHRRTFGPLNPSPVLPLQERDLRTRTGREAEEWVAADYRQRGARVLFRQWRGGGGELDLICRQDDCWIFVEVKGSNSPNGNPPLARLSDGQRKRWRSAAAAFLRSSDNYAPGSAVRFDLVALQAHTGGPPLMHRVEGVDLT